MARKLIRGFFTPARHFTPGSWGWGGLVFLPGGGVPIPGSGIGNKGYSRVGFVGQFYFGPHFDLQVVTQHGSDSAWFGQGYGGGSPLNLVPGTPLPPGAQAPSWNGALFEAHYVYSPQL